MKKSRKLFRRITALLVVLSITITGNSIVAMASSPSSGHFPILVNVGIVINEGASIKDVKIKGDFNDDGSVTLYDFIDIYTYFFYGKNASALRRYNEELGDIDNDGKITIRDVTLMCNYINWGSTITPNSLFSFSMVAKPSKGYKVSQIRVNNENLTIPESGGIGQSSIHSETGASLAYTVFVDSNGEVEFSCTSLSYNEVQVVFAPIS
ncbi:MAG: dockerin type I repeat-containing protein [Suipraeoptans sp.]